MTTTDMPEICPQCAKHIEPLLIGKDSKWGGIYVKCPTCGWKTNTWAREIDAWAEWREMQRNQLDEDQP